MREISRRRVLAGSGVALASGLAGCGQLWEDDEEPPAFDPSAIEPILSEPTPDVERPVPLQPAREAIDDGIGRYDELLGSLPLSLSAEDVPNGVVREEIESTREDAEAHRESVEAASDRFGEIQTVADARASAREAAAAFDAVGTDIASAIEAERRRTRNAVGARLAGVEYVGEDRDRTALLAANIERALLEAQRQLRHGFFPVDPDVLQVGELAGEVERARATLDTVEALADRHAGIVSEPAEFERSLGRALQLSFHALAQSDLATADATPGELLGNEPDRTERSYLMSEALRRVESPERRIEPKLARGELASGLEEAFVLERDVRALRSVVDRLVEDEFPDLETPEQVRAEREAALEAADAVPGSVPERSISMDVFARTLESLTSTDDTMHRYRDTGSDRPLQREYARYAYHRAQLEALPETIEAVRQRLEG